MAAIIVHRKDEELQQFKAPFAGCPEMLAGFEALPASPADTPQVEFAALAPDILNAAIPAFFIGRNSAGLWVAREANGRIGGLFVLKNSALCFARAQSGPGGCATIFPSQRFELDIENHGNPLAGHLASLIRIATAHLATIKRFSLC
jgi:hypothetical protein